MANRRDLRLAVPVHLDLLKSLESRRPLGSTRAFGDFGMLSRFLNHSRCLTRPCETFLISYPSHPKLLIENIVLFRGVGVSAKGTSATFAH